MKNSRGNSSHERPGRGGSPPERRAALPRTRSLGFGTQRQRVRGGRRLDGVAGDIRGARSRSAQMGADRLRCLVAAANAARAERLRSAADGGGWEVLSAKDLASAVSLLCTTSVQLGLVDLSGEPLGAGELRQLVELLASKPELLLVVSNEQSQGSEEAWARQLGAWMYLPGNIEPTGLTAICREALAIVERLQQSGRLPAYGD